MSSYSWSSSSYSSSSHSTSRDGQAAASHAYSTERRSGPGGTSVRTTTRSNGGPAVEETRHFDASGREVPGGRALEGGAGTVAGTVGEGEGAPREGRVVEDASGETDADRLYRERMEDEYAKREGGA